MGRVVPASVALVLNTLEEVVLATPFVVIFGGRLPGGVQSKRSILNWRAIALEMHVSLVYLHGYFFYVPFSRSWQFFQQ